MKWNKFLFAMDDLVYEDIQYSIHLTCSLCWKIKYSISLYIWAPFKTSQNVFFDIPFFALWRLLNSIHATLIPSNFFLQKLRETFCDETLLYIGNFILNSFVIIYVRRSVNLMLTFVPVSQWIFMKSFPHPG